jgi:UDP-GlcNAc3NAcA epimerase
MTIIGARPQFIKAGSVSRGIRKHVQIQEVIVHTGQHYDANMSDIFFEEMETPKPDYLLGIGGKSHGAMTGQMIEKIKEVCLEEKPDWIMVYGDTNSTLAGAIVSSKLHIKLAHIEAGLRSFDMGML